jgi:uncharacterized protein YbbC (DUF1343 family)
LVNITIGDTLFALFDCINNTCTSVTAFEYKKKKRVSYNHTRLRKVGASPNIPITETGAPYCVAELIIFSEPALYD